MAFRYCSPQQVTEVARIYLPDVSENTLPPEDIYSAIDEIEAQVNGILSPRYDLDIIQADVPWTVQRLAACLTACVLIGRYQTMQTNGGALDYIKRDIKMYTEQLAYNAVYDSSNKTIAAVIYPQAMDRPSNSILDRIYENGPRSY